MFEDADFIFSYTRAEALSDGVLVDVSTIAREAGFRWPVAITDHLSARLQPDTPNQQLGQSYQGRLWDVVWMASRAALGVPKKAGSDQVRFLLILAEFDEAEQRLRHHELELFMMAGPGDDGEPVVTIGFPEDF